MIFPITEPMMITLHPIPSPDTPPFRQMLAAYWREVMPHADVVQTPTRREAYLTERFAWTGDSHHPHWAWAGEDPVGFVSFALDASRKQAVIEDFYIAETKRRRGYGAATVQALCRHLDSLGIERIDLNVRRDNPAALAFWQAQGFGLALYCLRMYRDPENGTAFVGALSSDFVNNGA
jgi:ribosomal protein S18 acetylase RimI-like enzyme